jgi:hypothetical protein
VSHSLHGQRPVGSPRIAGSSEAGLAAWQALAALQDGKAAPTPDAVNSSFKRCDMQRPLVFESDSWQLEVSNMTGAIVGLRFKAGSASDSSSGGSSRSRGGLQRSSYGSSGSRPSLWTRIVGTLGWPGGSLSVSSGSGVGKSWAGFDAPLALPVYSTYAGVWHVHTSITHATCIQQLWPTWQLCCCMGLVERPRLGLNLATVLLIVYCRG